jgi:hypothetical protein
MANKKRRDRIRKYGGETDADDTSGKLCIEHLRRGFEAFRREHGPGTRIPQTLRDEALGAISGGTPEIEVRRACRITPRQLHWWRQGCRSCGQELELPQHKARVFPVVDDISPIVVEREQEQEVQQLQMRIGRWAISIRQLV